MNYCNFSSETNYCMKGSKPQSSRCLKYVPNKRCKRARTSPPLTPLDRVQGALAKPSLTYGVGGLNLPVLKNFCEELGLDDKGHRANIVARLLPFRKKLLQKLLKKHDQMASKKKVKTSKKKAKISKKKTIGKKKGIITVRNAFTIKPFKLFKNDRYDNSLVGTSLKPVGQWYACGQVWKDWVEDEMPYFYEEYEYRYRFSLDHSKMLVIQTEQELSEFIRKYGESKEMVFIDWTRVAIDYYGIEICAPGDSLPKGTKWTEDTKWLSSWDVASGCIWNSDAIVAIERMKLPEDHVNTSKNVD